MKKQANQVILCSLLMLGNLLNSQDQIDTDQSNGNTKLFEIQTILPVKLSYSVKDVEKNTNDSTYIKTELSYQNEVGEWQPLEVDIRARGNFRRKNCYFAPIKMKINSKVSDKTLFEGNKSLKLVLPCLLQKRTNDNIMEEYMAYKLFETISPYHFMTRLLDVDLTEEKNRKNVPHKLKGIFIEDDKKVAHRHNGNVLERSVHPLQQDDVCSVQNDFFQYMIGNTDYSSAYQHNQKLLFIDKRTMPLPYDFDMAGLIDASYSVVSQIQGESLGITEVTQRMYRGFKRDEQIIQQVRQEFLANKDKMIAVVDSMEPYFENPNEFSKAKKFILDFFPILENDGTFKREILDKGRTK